MHLFTSLSFLFPAQGVLLTHTGSSNTPGVKEMRPEVAFSQAPHSFMTQPPVCLYIPACDDSNSINALSSVSLCDYSRDFGCVCERRGRSERFPCSLFCKCAPDQISSPVLTVLFNTNCSSPLTMQSNKPKLSTEHPCPRRRQKHLYAAQRPVGVHAWLQNMYSRTLSSGFASECL